MTSLPHSVFLDLDDTILDDSSTVDTGWRTSFTALVRGIDVETALVHLHEIRDWYWSDPERHRLGRQDLRAASAWIVEEALARLGPRNSVLAREVANHYRDLRDQSMDLLPGAIEAIESLRSHGIQLALLTNGSAASQRAKIERFSLETHFDFICIEGEFGCGKPDERVYRGALDALKARPETTWMVGDNLEWDVSAPMRLGIRGIWLDRHGTGLPPTSTAKPDQIILSLTELL